MTRPQIVALALGLVFIFLMAQVVGVGDGGVGGVRGVSSDENATGVFGIVGTLLLGLSPAVVAVAAIVAGEVRDRRRLKHEQDMQELELAERRRTTLREERLQAYATMARLTSTMPAHETLKTGALAEAYSEIELLTENDQLKEAAKLLLDAVVEAWHTARDTIDRRSGEDPYGTPQYRAARGLWEEHRSTFIRLARDELQAKQSPGPRG